MKGGKGKGRVRVGYVVSSLSDHREEAERTCLESAETLYHIFPQDVPLTAVEDEEAFDWWTSVKDHPEVAMLRAAPIEVKIGERVERFQVAWPMREDGMSTTLAAMAGLRDSQAISIHVRPWPLTSEEQFKINELASKLAQHSERSEHQTAGVTIRRVNIAAGLSAKALERVIQSQGKAMHMEILASGTPAISLSLTAGLTADLLGRSGQWNAGIVPRVKLATLKNAHGAWSRLEKASLAVSDECLEIPFLVDDVARVFQVPRPTQSAGHAIPVRPAAPYSVGAALLSPTTGKIILTGLSFAGREVREVAFPDRLEDLEKHILVAGVPGSGKTTTLLSLLCHLWRDHRIPFMVLEPAKNEYRDLASLAGFEELKVFSPGLEGSLPFKINPLQHPTDFPRTTHADLLRSVFTASISMWEPLPSILAAVLDRCYSKFTAKDFFPSMAQLTAAWDAHVSALTYSETVKKDIREAMLTRLQRMSSGNLASTLLTSRDRIDDLWDKPCIVELQWFGDDADKSFLAGLLFLRRYESLMEARLKRGRGRPHILVIEEAHRLFPGGRERSANPELADPRSRAVETLVNMLSEVRAYHQGIVIVDQVPTRLAPEVIKNTNLKIIHRLVSADDREALGKSMNLGEAEKDYLTLLETGEAVVFFEGLPGGALVHVTPPDDLLGILKEHQPC